MVIIKRKTARKQASSTPQGGVAHSRRMRPIGESHSATMNGFVFGVGADSRLQTTGENISSPVSVFRRGRTEGATCN